MVGHGCLFELIRKSMYPAVLENLMGEDLLPLTSKVFSCYCYETFVHCV